MFETGMSALVLKICSEYAKSLGLNFPPCTQQEINAICQWVDKHTVKDLTMEQNGDSVTFRFVTENETVKEFTFTIPEQKVDVNVLEQLLIGSETVVVNRTEDNSKLQVRLAQSVANQINGKLDKPANPTAESAVTMLADGTVGTKLLSEIGGKLYLHNLSVNENEVISSNLGFYALSSYNGAITKSNILSLNISRFAVVNSGVLTVGSDLYDVAGAYIDGNNLVCEYYEKGFDIANEVFRFNINGSTTTITDTYTEV